MFFWVNNFSLDTACVEHVNLAVEYSEMCYIFPYNLRYTNWNMLTVNLSGQHVFFWTAHHLRK